MHAIVILNKKKKVSTKAHLQKKAIKIAVDQTHWEI
jgi:hypothetical protein